MGVKFIELVQVSRSIEFKLKVVIECQLSFENRKSEKTFIKTSNISNVSL